MLTRHILRASRSATIQLSQRTLPSQLPRAAASPSPIIRPASLLSSSRIQSARWYSDTASASGEAKQAESSEKVAEEVQKAPAGGEAEKLKKDLEAKSKEVLEFKDHYLRAVADYRNLQDRTAREKKSIHDHALKSLSRDLLPSIDNITHALNAVPAERLAAPSESTHQDLKNLHEGVKLMETVLLNALKKHGLEKFDPAAKSEKFDPNQHEAMFHAPQPGKEDGTVFHTQRPGYVLNGLVLRAAQVGIVKNS